MASMPGAGDKAGPLCRRAEAWFPLPLPKPRAAPVKPFREASCCRASVSSGARRGRWSTGDARSASLRQRRCSDAFRHLHSEGITAVIQSLAHGITVVNSCLPELTPVLPQRRVSGGSPKRPPAAGPRQFRPPPAGPQKIQDAPFPAREGYYSQLAAAYSGC